jgi:hypothetical protein
MINPCTSKIRILDYHVQQPKIYRLILESIAVQKNIDSKGDMLVCMMYHIIPTNNTYPINLFINDLIRIRIV